MESGLRGSWGDRWGRDPYARMMPSSPPDTSADDSPSAASADDHPDRDSTADRAQVIGQGVRTTAGWSARVLLIGLGAAGLLWILAQLWVGVLPVLLAMIVASVFSPAVGWLRDHRWPSAAAAGATVLAALTVIGGVLALIVRPVAQQGTELAASAGDGIDRLRDWLAGPPLGISNRQIDGAVAGIVDRLRSSAGDLAAGALTGVGAFTSGLVTFILVLVLTFLFLKDGTSFLPWLRRRSGPTVGAHLTEMFTRMWSTLGSFIRIQALVSLIDAVLIGLGLVILGVPLAAPLAVITFFASFVPIVGAIAAGALAVVVALVSNGPTTALLVIGVIVVVQQLESNVLQPFLQGKSLELPAAVVLLSVTIGGTLFGISGAFLAVPVVATAATALRYLDQQVALRAGETVAEDVTSQTRAGDRMARRAQAWRQRRRRTDGADG